MMNKKTGSPFYPGQPGHVLGLRQTCANDAFELRGMITVKDMDKASAYPDACKDSLGRLRVGAAVGVGPDIIERAEALLTAGADAIVIDTSHGHSANVIDARGKASVARSQSTDNRKRPAVRDVMTPISWRDRRSPDCRQNR